MKKIVSKIKKNNKIKKLLFFTIIFFLFCYIFSIPSFSGMSKFNLVTYFSLAALTGVTGLYIFFYSKIVFSKRLLVPCYFVFFSLVGTIFFSHQFRSWLSLLLLLISFFISYHVFNIIGQTKLILKIIVLAFLAFAIFFSAIYWPDILRFRFTSKAGSFFDGVNVIGFYFAIAFSLSFYIALFRDKKSEFIYLLLSLLFCFLGLFTGSRAFIFVTLFGCITVLFLRLKKHPFMFLLSLVVVIGLIFILINIPQLSFLKEQFERALYTIFGIGGSKIDTSTVQRVLWPRYAFYLSSKNVFIGYGCGGFAIYSGIGTYAHNNFAETLCNFGLIGFALYYLCYFYPLLYSIKQKREIQIVILFFVLFIVRSFFGVVYYSKESYLIIALCFYITKDCRANIFSKASSLAKDYYECKI